MAPLKSIRSRKVQETLTLTAKDKYFFPFPEAWEDEVLYFLLPDRFSNNTERDYRDIHNNLMTTGTTPLYRPEDKGNALSDEKSWVKWMTAGSDFVVGNIRGTISKLGYLKRLGVTAIWIAPFLKQVRGQPTYHGYSVQNFLEVDPRFGTRKDFRTLVKAAYR
jgi:glycosidase